MIQGQYLQTAKGLSLLFFVMFVLLPVHSFALDRQAFVRLSGTLQATAPAKVMVADLEKLPLTTYATTNPFENERITYSGVLLKDLVAAYSSPACSTVILTARDDYQVAFHKAEWQRWDLMLATRADGKIMGISESGPVRIVMPFDTADDLDQGVYTPKWIWLIKSIEFKVADQDQ